MSLLWTQQLYVSYHPEHGLVQSIANVALDLII